MAKKSFKNLSRQRLKQIQHRAAGLCERCSRPAIAPYTTCSRCLNRQRKQRGHKAWKPGGVGRPPVAMKAKIDAAYAAAQAAFESVLGKAAAK